MPEHPGFRLFLAGLQERQKNDRAARALRAEAEALRLRDPRYHLQCGRWLQDGGDLLAARRCFAKAIEIDSIFAPAYHELARNQDYCGATRESRWRFLETCARYVPGDPLTRALLAKALERQGRIHDALVQIETANELDAENPHYRCLHGRVLRRIGRLDAAEQAVRRGMALDDLAARMQTFGRQSVVEGGEITNGARRPRLSFMQSWPRSCWREATCWRRRRPRADALSLARVEPDRYHRLSEVLAMKGAHAEAAQELEAAISLARQEMRWPTPRDWPLIDRNRNRESRANRLSRILSAGGHRDEAISVLREVLVAVPDSSPIKDNLAGTVDRER